MPEHPLGTVSLMTAAHDHIRVVFSGVFHDYFGGIADLDPDDSLGELVLSQRIEDRGLGQITFMRHI